MQDSSENRSDRLTKLEQRLDEKAGDFAEAWRPSEGDSVIGEVIRTDRRDGGHGTYLIVTLQTDQGEIAIHAFHEVLKREFEERAPQIGELIAVKYLGEKQGRAGNRYHAYTVVWDEGEVADAGIAA